MLLAVLGVVFLLANPAGICAGMAGAGTPSPSHACCPKPAGDTAKAPCICIDRQPAAPALPAIGELTQAAVTAPVPAAIAEMPAPAAEFVVEEAAGPAPHAILLSIHQLLL
jgi:hypothetical protein